MKQLYLSGAITNNPNYKQEFETAYKKLIKSGYSVVSPLIFCNDDWDWNTCMRKCLEILARNKNLSIALIDNQYKHIQDNNILIDVLFIIECISLL